MKGIIEWHDAQKELPKYDGDYLVSHFSSFTNFGIDYENTVTEVYHWYGDQKLWVSINEFRYSINALIPQGDSDECIISWAKFPEPYEPVHGEVSDV